MEGQTPHSLRPWVGVAGWCCQAAVPTMRLQGSECWERDVGGVGAGKQARCPLSSPGPSGCVTVRAIEPWHMLLLSHCWSRVIARACSSFCSSYCFTGKLRIGAVPAELGDFWGRALSSLLQAALSGGTESSSPPPHITPPSHALG